MTPLLSNPSVALVGFEDVTHREARAPWTSRIKAIASRYADRTAAHQNVCEELPVVATTQLLAQIPTIICAILIARRIGFWGSTAPESLGGSETRGPNSKRGMEASAPLNAPLRTAAPSHARVVSVDVTPGQPQSCRALGRGSVGVLPAGISFRRGRSGLGLGRRCLLPTPMFAREPILVFLLGRSETLTEGFLGFSWVSAGGQLRGGRHRRSNSAGARKNGPRSPEVGASRSLWPDSAAQSSDSDTHRCRGRLLMRRSGILWSRAPFFAQFRALCGRAWLHFRATVGIRDRLFDPPCRLHEGPLQSWPPAHAQGFSPLAREVQHACARKRAGMEGRGRGASA